MEIIGTQNRFRTRHGLIQSVQKERRPPMETDAITCKCRIRTTKHLIIYSIRKVYLPCLIRLCRGRHRHFNCWVTHKYFNNMFTRRKEMWEGLASRERINYETIKKNYGPGNCHGYGARNDEHHSICCRKRYYGHSKC